jgi:glycine/D-amino acid oxidase-like deaminating enzyme
MTDGRSRAVRIPTDSAQPQSSDIVIIGGGLLGICTAYFLARSGHSVVVCEKGVVAGEASGRSVGQVASAGLESEKMPLVVEAKRLWQELSDEIGRDGGDIGYRQDSFIAPCTNSDETGTWEKWLAGIQDFEPDGTMLTGGETAEHVTSTKKWTGAYYNPGDGCAEPKLAAPAIAKAARALGAIIVESCAVRGLELSAGRVCAVVTEKGTINTSTVVLAAGSWSMLFARSLGIDLPILGLDATCQSVAPIDSGPPGTGDLPAATWRKELDGGYTICVIGGTIPIVPAMFRIGLQFLPVLRAQAQHWDLNVRLGKNFFADAFTPKHWPLDKPSPFEKTRIMDRVPDEYFNRKAQKIVAETIPAFRGMQVRDAWGGVVATTPDNMPTISPVQKLPGLHLLTGFSYGLTMGPGAAKLLVDLITGATPAIDPTPYRYERYTDGSKLKVVQ